MRYRWVVLAAGTFAQAAYSALLTGLSVIAPSLRTHFDLGLTQVGVVLACVNVGSMLTLIPWGMLADRIGERVVALTGLGVAAVAVAAAAFAHGFWALSAAVAIAGAAGASVNSASGRAVLAWFDPARRGTALGIRQTAIPIGSFATALVLPRLSIGAAFAVLAGWLAVGAVAALALREGPAPPEPVDPGEVVAAPLLDRRLWRIALASSFLVAVQSGVWGFTPLFLHGARGVSKTDAGAVVAAIAVLGGALRIGSGRWSDVVRARVPPLRWLSVALAAAVVATAAFASAPLAVLVPVLVVAGGLSMSWNGLSFTVAAEAVGHGRSGAAIGFQQTALALASAVAAPAFAAGVAASSWRAGFGVLAIAPVLAWRVLAPVRG